MHYTLYRLDNGKEVGCANKLLPDKVQKMLGVRMEESDQNECEECQED